MKISYNWLKTYIDTSLSAEEAAEKLTLLGLEVEETEPVGREYDGFVVGQVLEVSEHPNADKLTLCQVDLGNKKVQIACGAKNVASGQKVPVAPTGTTLPGQGENGEEVIIKKIKLRGEVSEGMICSESELGLSDDHSGILVLHSDLKTGTPLNQALGIEEDTVFDIGLTPNRPDASCHIGVARDLSAALGTGLKNPYSDIKLDDTGRLNDYIDIQIEDEKQCHRYAGKIVTDINVGESPDWLKNRLVSIGLRPVNNVVDATNFILHEVGQPLHAFDYDQIEGKKIVVKHFDDDVEFETIDHVTRTVPAGTLFICDGEKPVAIAGIMGGVNSEVSDDAATVLIESAYFNPPSIRSASKKLGLQTDSSYRFERGIDPNLARKACERAANLIAELSGGRVVEGCADLYPVKTSPRNVHLRIDRLNSLLGTSITPKKACTILNALEIETATGKKGKIECTVPTFRPDITREADLIEEVGRIFDYNNIPSPKYSPFHSPAPLTRWEVLHNRVRNVATRLQYKEITTNSLISEKEAELFSSTDDLIHTLNPVSSVATTLRTTLLTGFLKSVTFNLNRNAERLRFFEIGHVYRYGKDNTWIEGIEEHSQLLLGLCGFNHKDNWSRDAEHVSIFDLKSDLESLLGQIGIFEKLTAKTIDQKTVNYLYKDAVIATLNRIDSELTDEFDIDLPVCAATLNLTLAHRAGLAEKHGTYTEVPRFPAIEYDAAYIVSSTVSAGELINLIRQHGGELLHNIDVFDVYEGKNLGKKKKSIAFRFTFLDRNKTLTIKDVEPAVQNVTRVLEKETGAKLRS